MHSCPSVAGIAESSAQPADTHYPEQWDAPLMEEHRPPSAELLPMKEDCSCAGLHADSAGRAAATGVRSATHRRLPIGRSAVNAIKPALASRCCLPGALCQEVQRSLRPTRVVGQGRVGYDRFQQL